MTGTLWRGGVVRIARGGVRQATSEEPRDEAQMTAAVGTASGLLAALTAVFGAVRLVRPRRSEPIPWALLGRPSGLTAVAVCFGTGFLALWPGLPWWVVPVVAAPGAGSVAVLLYRHRRSAPGV
ncbi:hypothetical protein [Streptomyces tropicalis]|uniref:Integral membrane protein n=1 Tax=Streptomyces tropicalis TaxID=3034234 RepID=A0ABT6A0S2_9ACTN|nr:hypothetical protein [Streptomyces tropicalis]MDF3298068.1 hypothetical protein [Streptomyces tropicalis]